MQDLAALSLPDHMACGCLGPKHRALKIHVKDVVELILGDFFSFLFPVQTHCVNKNVQTSKTLHYLIAQARGLLHRNGFKHEPFCSASIPAELASRKIGLYRIVPGYSHCRPGLCQRPSHRGSDASISPCAEATFPVNPK